MHNGDADRIGHSIEFCTAEPTQTGHVDIPLRILAPIVIEALQRDALTEIESTLILNAAAESIGRTRQEFDSVTN